MNVQLLLARIRMQFDQFFQVRKNLVERHRRVGLRATLQKSQIAARDIQAMNDLMIDAVDVLPDAVERGTIDTMRADEIVAHFVEVTADDRERTVDVVKNAGVNFSV